MLSQYSVNNSLVILDAAGKLVVYHLEALSHYFFKACIIEQRFSSVILWNLTNAYTHIFQFIRVDNCLQLQ
jgi:hypothetical protein